MLRTSGPLPVGAVATDCAQDEVARCAGHEDEPDVVGDGDSARRRNAGELLAYRSVGEVEDDNGVVVHVRDDELSFSGVDLLVVESRRTARNGHVRDERERKARR